MLSVRRQGADRANPLRASAGWATSAPSPAEPRPWASRAEAQGCGCWPGGLRPAGHPQGRRGLLALLGSARPGSAVTQRCPSAARPPSPLSDNIRGRSAISARFPSPALALGAGMCRRTVEVLCGQAGGRCRRSSAIAAQRRLPAPVRPVHRFGDAGCVGRLQAGIFTALWGGVWVCVCLVSAGAVSKPPRSSRLAGRGALGPASVLEETHSPCPCRGAGGAG